MVSAADNALIVQSDSSVLLDVHAPRAGAARAALAPFAELVKSPEHVHTYRLTPLSIWNARAAGLAAGRMVEALREHARYPVPPGVEQDVLELAARYGRVVIARDGDGLRCTCHDAVTAERLARDKEAGQYLTRRIDATSFRVDPAARGILKQALVAAGYPAEDLAGYVAGEPFAMALREKAVSRPPFRVRDYQRDAAEACYLAGSERGGSGIIVLPCGAGKTNGRILDDLSRHVRCMRPPLAVAGESVRREVSGCGAVCSTPSPRRVRRARRPVAGTTRSRSTGGVGPEPTAKAMCRRLML